MCCRQRQSSSFNGMQYAHFNQINLPFAIHMLLSFQKLRRAKCSLACYWIHWIEIQCTKLISYRKSYITCKSIIINLIDKLLYSVFRPVRRSHILPRSLSLAECDSIYFKNVRNLIRNGNCIDNCKWIWWFGTPKQKKKKRKTIFVLTAQCKQINSKINWMRGVIDFTVVCDSASNLSKGSLGE